MNARNIKNSSTISSIIFILVFTLGVSCKDDDNVLPPISMVGNNTFGCYVNGELWLPEGRGGGSLPFLVDRSGEFFLGVYADNHSNNTGMSLILIDSSGLQIKKVYNLTNRPSRHAEYNFRINNQTCFYSYTEMISGSMTISKLENNVVSGTFEFTSFNSDCGDTLKVTEGRFDIGKIAY